MYFGHTTFMIEEVITTLKECKKRTIGYKLMDQFIDRQFHSDINLQRTVLQIIILTVFD